MEYENIIEACIAQKKQVTIERGEIKKFHDKIMDKEGMLLLWRLKTATLSGIYRQTMI